MATKARKDPPGDPSRQWPGGRGATNPRLNQQKANRPTMTFGKDGKPTNLNKTPSQRYKTPGLIDHPRAYERRHPGTKVVNEHGISNVLHSTSKPATRRQATPGVIDHPADYMKRHPNARLTMRSNGTATIKRKK